MDHNDLRIWARDNQDRFNGMLNQYLVGNQSIEEALVRIIDTLHPVRDTSKILQEIQERLKEVEDGDSEDWASWLVELSDQIRQLKTTQPTLTNSPPLPLETPKPPFNFRDMIENGVDTNQGNPLWGSFRGRYYPAVSKEAGVRVVESYGLEGDPRKAFGTVLPVRKQEDEEYVLVPPQTTVILNTREKVKMNPSVVVILSGHPTYQAVGLETRGGVLDEKSGKIGSVEVQLTNPKSTPIRVYLGHGACELTFIPLGR
ncbi:MAG: dCTP deaminase domain-containing protein [Terrimicrobiaceae bacterium]